MTQPYQEVVKYETGGKIYQIVARRDVMNPNGSVDVFLNGKKIVDTHEALPSEQKAELLEWGKQAAWSHAMPIAGL